ncbi:hypothetical protein [Litchfieldia alkalitelluris]|uniref:hypothetical protein n=1 Tax=Litchfieldia alkalitelluris TaxID=304268 RepID=UPI000996C229|nr:hypothetical protein [Litchfieldia alkalitelluris]
MFKKMSIILVILMLSLLTACYADGGRVTARDAMKNDDDADILQYHNGKVYANYTDLEWFQEDKEKYTKKQLVGEIIKQTDSRFMFKDFYATKLPVGAKIYSTSEDAYSGILIVEHDGQTWYYGHLLEG